MVDPGPVDRSVLRLQHLHRSEDVWSGATDKLLYCREHVLAGEDDWVVDDRVMEYVRDAGFYGVHRVRGGGVMLDRALITALVERWRQETHSFHLVTGEATITLQDVAVLFGLRIHGEPVTDSPQAGAWADIIADLLGVRPGDDEAAISGSSLKLTWLRRHFSPLPADADDLVVQRFSRAYLLYLIGTVLFADKSGASVQLIYLPLLRDWERVRGLSWGSAALAFLYRQLCRASRRGAKEINGPLILLQLWSWERIHVGRPVIRGVREPPEADHDAIVATHPLGSQHQPGTDPLACRYFPFCTVLLFHYPFTTSHCS